MRLSRRLCALVGLGLVAAVVGGLGVYPLVRESIEIGRLGDPEARGAAMEALRELRSRRAVPHLVGLLDEEDHFLRWDILQALEDIGFDGQAEPIAEAIFVLTEETPQLKQLCSLCVEQCRGFVAALMSGAVTHCDWMRERDMSGGCRAVFDFLSEHADASLAHLKTYLYEDLARARFALEIIARIGRPADKLCSAVVRLLGHEDAGLQTSVGYALQEMQCCSEDLCDPIAAAAEDEDFAVRGWIAALMAKKCEPCRASWITGLRSLLRDSFTSNRVSAVQAIGAQGFIRELEQELCDAMANDLDEEVKVMCAQVIWEAKEEERFVKRAQAALPEASGFARYALAALLYKVRPSADLRQVLEDASKCRHNTVRNRAIELLKTAAH